MKHNFKIGDKLICLPGFETHGKGDLEGGMGYKPGKEIIVKKIDDWSRGEGGGGDIIWPDDNGNGIYARALAKVGESNIHYEVY